MARNEAKAYAGDDQGNAPGVLESLSSRIGCFVVSGCHTGRGHGPDIRYMAWGNPEQLAVEQQLVDEFMRQNPDIRVRLFKVPQSAYLNKAIIMLASGRRRT